ncbi:MAG: hypothetical protein NTY74_10315 [Ignavibacteriae bacterium]|nr:hypothetical protein [Ignavibacteriota bacterium]
MKKFVVLFVLICSMGFPQSKQTFNEKDWLGNWKGTLNIIMAGKFNTVPMELWIYKTDTPDKYGWKTSYGQGVSALKKDYFLYPKDAERGEWILDEDNNILLDFFYGDNQFHSFFETQNILLSSRYDLKDGKIFMEVLSAQKEKQSKSGSGKEECISYPIYVIQKAELTKN